MKRINCSTKRLKNLHLLNQELESRIQERTTELKQAKKRWKNHWRKSKK